MNMHTNGEPEYLWAFQIAAIWENHNKKNQQKQQKNRIKYIA